MPDHFEINDNLIDKPASPEEAKNLEIVYGPNIKPVPNGDALPESIEAEVVLKVGDKVQAKIIGIDFDKKRVSLSIRALLEPAAEDEAEETEAE